MNFETLKGKVITEIVGGVGDERLELRCTDGASYSMYHSQDCCERVSIEDICGDFDDILNSEVIDADESTSDINPEGVVLGYQDSFTWTFYKISTAKGSVTIRWYGESNGYYSERVYFEEVKARSW